MTFPGFPSLTPDLVPGWNNQANVPNPATPGYSLKAPKEEEKAVEEENATDQAE